MSNKVGVTLLLLFVLLAPSKLFAQSDSLIFSDDFNRDSLGTDWVANATWSIADGMAANYIDGIGGTLRTSRYFTADSYVIETAAKGFSNDYWRQFRIVFGQTSLTSDSAYVISYTPDAGGQFALARATDNLYYPQLLDESIIYPDLDSLQLYKFKIAKYKSGLIQVFIDKGEGYSTVPVLEAIDSAYQQLGHFGWQEDTQTGAKHFYVEGITVWNPEVEKPATEEKPAEDDLVTQVSAASGAAYHVTKLNVGVTGFTDRTYTITSVPDYLQGASLVQTAMNDKADTSSALLTMFIKKDAIVYVAYDPRGNRKPAWLKKGWKKTKDVIGVSDTSSNYLEVYSKVVEYGETYPHPYILGGNLQSPATGSEMNYLVAVVEKPVNSRLEAEDATLHGAVVATDHQGYSGSGFVDYINPTGDYIEWSVKTDVPGYYSLGISFSNGRGDIRPICITVDKNQVITYPFSATYNWKSWAFYSGPSVYLSRGMHKIKATAAGASGPNLDYLTLSYAAAPVEVNLAVAGLEATEAEGRQHSIADEGSVAYPNPFVESTTISYALNAKMPVYLTVYNMQGQKVGVLVNEMQEAGEHNITFKANSLKKGLYIYQLKTGDGLRVGKLLKQ
ncbi:T9SS type A sorting domain-containing protein [Pontibacter sp. 172403-2]|uniref:T9SS type A sorting domain-containing protein n=1 Tax=Pontibacter rufus TaxID=2791028 RepID=UPI0018AF7818|nr:T9SS type A sorting domain-containing protein [Pontibacter sp. 172403-2]MBF9252720.1 T9SS type A sorting domain-containing protein [Pontibacter sp. 172403-2]